MQSKYKDIKKSEGPEILEGDRVELYYKLAFNEADIETGAFIESTYMPDIPVQLTYSKEDMLLGLFYGMENMRTGGSIRRIFIPADLGYGNRKWGPIKENSDLVLEVCLARKIY
jgi:FKBP-type peptidyl-prolyl cis-trans isomerase